ncbi:unnamed protein product [Diatraea saccharalis]|uniref:Uncharacterized protein n=1 Tax=Diatraea saccharalis TaxID=40085 RepID=A0A9N9W5L8_9NEOP|nr:unnamed protein product [Diatraea saccharalis]
MEPKRKLPAGPMALSSMKAAKKTLGVYNAPVNKSNAPTKELITVHTATPHLEHKSYNAEQNQIYQGEVNVLSVMEKRQTLGLCYHPHYTKFVTYGDDAKLNMYDEEAQTQERAFYSSPRKNIVDGHTSRIFACAFNPKSHHELISGGWDDTVICWDDRQPYATRHIFGVHMCGEGLDFDKPGKQTECSIRNNPGGIYAFDFGTVRRKTKKVPDTYKRISEIDSIPRVVFVTGNRLQTVDFG